MKLIDVPKAFATDEMCLAYLEAMRWPAGVRCPICGAKEVSKITRKSKSKNVRAQLYQCLEKTCKTQFSATSGTIFHDSHLPLSKWFTAIALMIDAKKGKSALELSRNLGCNYRTAWYLAHRIREAMNEPDGLKLTGTVEIDETYIGGKQRGHKGKLKNKDVVLGIRQRGGPLKLVQVTDNKAGTLYDQVAKHVDSTADRIMTDDTGSYNFRLTKFRDVPHSRIRHSAGEYVKGEVHTNTVESAFSLLKRAVIGTYHQLSIKHLQRYLNEFSYRFNRREIADMFEQTVARMAGIGAMPYSKLVEQNAFTPFVRTAPRTSEPF
ncbi:MAG: IS1595 family transposase [Acidobacteriia bacterium]|nr:IS1595 family transposase [Terriglobia bacterium]